MANVVDMLFKDKMSSEGARASDGVEDMTAISDIDVNGINQNLKVRYNRDQIYTYTGTILVAVNPYKFLPVYEQETLEKYSGKKMGQLPPHIFATAEAAYKNIQRSDDNQSCVISGESGAGKTETTKFILQYLCTVTSSVTKWVEQQILEANTILEAFGNARTVRNDNSSRFGKFMQVCFDADCQIKGSIIQEYLLEQSRITFQAKEERNYHVFYQLVKGADKEKYLLQPIESYNYLNQSGCYSLNDVNDAMMLEELTLAMTVLNIGEEYIEGIYSLVSAVLQCGQLQFKDLDGESCALTPDDKETATKISKLLQIPYQAVEEVLLTRQIHVRGTVTTIPFRISDAMENASAMAKALYSRTFTWLVDRINATTNPGAHTAKFIGVLDIFGFENFGINSFEQLCINFTNEKLHKFFNHYVFALEQAEYEAEGINFSHIKFTDNTETLELIEKPPKCVLRLLDEECRFPKGTDETYLGKQHEALSHHPNYVQTSKARLDQEFGIKHFAGTVVYQIYGFLEKNKDVIQDQLFEHMRSSGSVFVKDVTKFQSLLTNERKMIMKKKINTSMGGDDGMRTNKAKPTVGDTFRRQLAALVDVLEETTPWYVRCIKPNSEKTAGKYDDELVTTQLQYSGMLDIVRIRKEGFPVHVPAEKFVDKYHAVASLMGKSLSKDAKEATRQILTYIKAPETEWQVGKTKVFLRNSVFEPLDDKLRELVNSKVLLIQRIWRGHRQRKIFVEKKLSIVKIQAAVRGAALRLRYLQHRRSAVKIQSAVRGWFAREFVNELRAKKKAEEEKRKKEERERVQRESQEKGEQMMEESFLSAQKELFAMAKMAEMKADTGSPTKSAGDLDKLFTFLDDKKDQKEDEYLEKINNELDAMFAEQAPKPSGTRTIRRKKRVQPKLLFEEKKEEERAKKEESIDPAEYGMLQFAEKYFNSHPKPGSGSIRLTSRRRSSDRQAPVDDPLAKEDMIKFSKSNTMASSLVHMHNPENVNFAISIFKDICKHMKGDVKPEHAVQSIRSIVAYCLERPELRDEIYCQLIRQTTNNPRPESTIRGWELICICCASFPASKLLYKYLQAYLILNKRDAVIGERAQWSLDALRRVKTYGPRRLAPSGFEIGHIKNMQSVVCRFYFLDGKAKAVGIHSCDTATDVVQTVAAKIGLRSTDGWALFESTPQAEHFIRGHEYLGDILAEWEVSKRSSAQMSKYQTVSKKGYTQALGGGEGKFVFRKRLFKNPREIPTDPVEYSLLYAQAVHSAVRVDEFPVNDKVALQLAGLQAQITWGDADETKLSRYAEINSYLPRRIQLLHKDRTPDEWMHELLLAHREYGNGKTDLQARVLYLTAVKQYPLYGCTFFDVQYKGFWSFPTRLLLAVHEHGFKFVDYRTKESLAAYNYDSLKNVEVNTYEDSLILHMEQSASEEHSHFMLLCPRHADVANLIASYSPTHRNWKQVGTAAVHRKKASADEKQEMQRNITSLRVQLVQSGGLKKPAESSKGFLATTLRRYSKSKLDKQEKEEALKSYDSKYWSYSKSKMSQSLTQMSDEAGDELAIRMFNSLLIFSGLASSGGFEEEGDQGNMALVQNVIGQCLEREDCCNEFYLQLIKQTTDQPDPNGSINVANWRFFVLTLGVVIPRNKLLLNYIQLHLRRCSVEPDTEEGKFAQFCQQALARTLENKNRKYPPSSTEIMCVAKRSQIHSRFHFMDGEYRALMFDAAATTAEVVSMVKERVGLGPQVQGFSLFEVFGSLERNMLAWEKVADAIFKWEKYAKSTHSQKELRLTFKKRIFLKPFGIPQHPVEFDLVFNQAIDDVKSDRFPVTNEEAAYLVALRAQVELGDVDPHAPVGTQYSRIIDQYMPKHLRQLVQPEDISAEHVKLRGKSKDDCNRAYLGFVQRWPLYGSTIFEVLQSYTSTLPKNLWLAVNETGIHIMRRRAKEPLISYSYRNIVNYSPSLRNLMIVTESLTRGTKFVFNTSQASQIAHLIKDYTHIIIKRKQSVKKK